MINQNRLVKTFCDIVKIDSPSNEEEAMALEMCARLGKLGFNIERDTHGNIIASEDGDKPLLLSAHLDTVEPGRGIRPSIDGDRIVSDGTTILGGDCKAGVAAILEALESLKEDNQKRKVVQLAFTRGEEIGLVGARNMDYSMINAHEAVVFDGNGPVNTVTSSSPSYMKLDVTINGISAHAGVEPEKGLSAIKIAADIINELPQGRLDEETTFNTGTISGGSVRNTVPDQVTFTGEFRSHNLETLDLLRVQVLDILDRARIKYETATIEEDMTLEFQMYSVNRQSSLVKTVSNCLNSLDLVPILTPSGGGTDANIMLLHGIDSVVVGMSTNEMHTVREYVVIPDLVNTARFCQEVICFAH